LEPVGRGLVGGAAHGGRAIKSEMSLEIKYSAQHRSRDEAVIRARGAGTSRRSTNRWAGSSGRYTPFKRVLRPIIRPSQFHCAPARSACLSGAGPPGQGRPISLRSRFGAF
jgi:hypothetical protein